MNLRRLSYAAILLGPSLFSCAQSMATGPVGIAHIALRAGNVEREVAFLEKLGFQQSFANTANGVTTQAFVKVNDRQFIEVYPINAGGESPGPLGLMHICYEAADLKSLYDRYLEEGLKAASWRKAGAGNLLFNLQDPDGRVTEFTQYMPGSRQMDDMGQHIGASRVSEELIGLWIPVKDLKASQKFYEQMGFSAAKEGENLGLDLAANPDIRMVLHPGKAADRAQTFFLVDDAAMAVDQLRAAGLDPIKDKKQASVHDPDGNVFVFVQAESKKPRHLIPWKK